MEGKCGILGRVLNSQLILSLLSLKEFTNILEFAMVFRPVPTLPSYLLSVSEKTYLLLYHIFH